MNFFLEGENIPEDVDPEKLQAEVFRQLQAIEQDRMLKAGIGAAYAYVHARWFVGEPQPAAERYAPNYKFQDNILQDESHEPLAIYDILPPSPLLRLTKLLPAIRPYLCPALQSLSNDGFDIAKGITPVMLTLKLSGKLPVDLDPWLIAATAFVVQRAGIASFCAGIDSKIKPDAEPKEQKRETNRAPKTKKKRSAPNTRQRPRPQK